MVLDFTDDQLQSIVDAELDAQVLCVVDGDDLVITHANEVARQLLGDVSALPVVGALPWACQEVWAGGRGVNLTDVLWPGERRWVDMRVRHLYGRVSVVFTDVTTRHQERVALLDSQCRFRLLAENAGDLVFAVRGRRVEWVSASIRELLGWEQSDVVGRRIVDLVHPYDHEHVVNACCEATAPTTFEARFRRHHGEYVRLSVEMRPAVDLGGGVARVGSCRQVEG